MEREKKVDFVLRMKETLKYSGGVIQYGKERFKGEINEFLSN